MLEEKKVRKRCKNAINALFLLVPSTFFGGFFVFSIRNGMSKKEEGGKTREWEAAPHTRNTFPLVPYLLVYATTKPNPPPPPTTTDERTNGIQFRSDEIHHPISFR
jgi:hypothetical protein